MIKYFEISTGTPPLHLAESTTREGVEIISWLSSEFYKGENAVGSVLYTPQSLTPEQQSQSRINIGLGNADNTSDVDKPISTATQQALNTLTTAVRQRVESTTFEQYKAEQVVALNGKADKANTFTKAEVVAIANEKANTDDYYPQMSVGFADNLVGRGEATAEEISFRPTAGALSIESGTARIENIKGNSLVWNQQVQQVIVGQYDVGGWFSKGHSVEKNENNTYVVSGESTEKNCMLQYINFDSTHIYLITFGVMVTSELDDGVYRIGYLGGDLTTWFEFIDKSEVYNKRKDFAVFIQPISGSNLVSLGVYAILASQIIYSPRIHDLTKMFGAGNEPTTVEEFYERMLLNVDMNAYNEGEIIDNHCNGIKTVGFNQWDEQWRTGLYASTSGNYTYNTVSICNVNPIRVIGGESYRVNIDNNVYAFFYDRDMQFISYANMRRENTLAPQGAMYMNFYVDSGYGTTYNNDICVNLSHTGYKNGTYEPYNTFTRGLDVIQKYFPNGMRKAGDVCDEIRFDHSTQKWEAVQNVGVRDYIEADSTDASVTTDGTNTNYPLATPIVIEIAENVNFDYYVEDFGTEEALAEVASAPFAADIIYQFNAVDRIRQNTLTIEELQQIVQQLQSQVTTLQNASNEAVVE